MTFERGSLYNGVTFPAAYVDENGKFLPYIPDRFSHISPMSISEAFICYKGGLKYFAERKLVRPRRAKKFAEYHHKHYLWENVGISEKDKEKIFLGGRMATVTVMSASGHDYLFYEMTLDRLPKEGDTDERVTKFWSRLSVDHKCKRASIENARPVPYRIVKRWFRDLTKEGFEKRIENAGKVRVNFLCTHIMTSLILLANEFNPVLKYNGALDERILEEKMGIVFDLINHGTLRYKDLNKLLYPRFFEEIGLTQVMDKLRDIWEKETHQISPL